MNINIVRKDVIETEDADHRPMVVDMKSPAQQADPSEVHAAPAVMQNKNALYFMFGMAAFFLACIILLVAVYLYLNPKSTDSTAGSASGTDVAGQPAVILSKTRALAELPGDETPQIIPITDLSSFQNQAFFARAHVGDVLILYLKNHVAVLYDPVLNKIINMSKISIIIPKPPAI